MNNQIKVAGVFYTRNSKFVIYGAQKNGHRPKYYLTRQPKETGDQFMRRVSRIVHQSVNMVIKPHEKVEISNATVTL